MFDAVLASDRRNLPAHLHALQVRAAFQRDYLMEMLGLLTCQISR